MINLFPPYLSLSSPLPTFLPSLYFLLFSFLCLVLTRYYLAFLALLAKICSHLKSAYVLSVVRFDFFSSVVFGEACLLFVDPCSTIIIGPDGAFSV